MSKLIRLYKDYTNPKGKRDRFIVPFLLTQSAVWITGQALPDKTLSLAFRKAEGKITTITILQKEGGVTMLEKITETIYKLVINPNSKINSVDCYLVGGETGYTVVDTGINPKNANGTRDKFPVPLSLPIPHPSHVIL